MSRRSRFGGRLEAATGVVLLVGLVVLLVMSSKTGQREFTDARHLLDRVQELNLRLDGSMYILLFEFQTDFDELTSLAADLREATAEYTAALPQARAERLMQPVNEKLRIIEDFKSEQSVQRNSRAIAAQTIESLWGTSALPQATRIQLFGVERAYLQFLSRRDPPSAQTLRQAVKAAAGTPLAELPEWRIIESHLLTLAEYSERVGQVMMSVWFVPLQPVLLAEVQELERGLATSAAVASRFRYGMFAVALLLLGFSGAMVVKQQRYLRLIERSNDELESRVAERTEQLAGANEELRKQIAEREIIESQLRMSQKLEAIGQLAAGIAHEINTPTQYASDNVRFVAGVWGDLARLLEDYERILAGDTNATRSKAIWDAADVEFVRGEVPAALRQTIAGLGQISRIVSAIRTFSHPGSDTLQPADVNQAIESTVTVARNQWKYLADVKLDLDPSLRAVRCDVSALNQVFLNLLVNASHAIADNHKEDTLGLIIVSTRKLRDYAEIVVEDDGPGVPAEIRERIFEPFFTTKEVGKGTGQGLAIAHQVIHKQHGGTITVHSAASGGARFVIHLPLARDQVEHDEPPLRLAVPA